MDVIRLEGVFKDGYGTIPKSVMQDKNLHVTAKALYAYMNSYSGHMESCFPSRNKIAYDLNISNETLGKYIKQLVQNGYITVTQQKEKGRFSCNVYTILLSKKPCAEIPVTENTVIDQLDTNNNSINNNSNISLCHGFEKTNPDGEKVKTKTKKQFDVNSDAYLLARYLEKQILENNSKFPQSDAQRQRWAVDFDLMLRRDKIEADDIAEVIKWCQADNFWRSNILSGKKFREKYQQLRMRMESR